MTNVKLNNYAREVDHRGREPYFHWRVFVDAPTKLLSDIAEVEYRLHPTFPKPIRRSSDPSDQFALETSGWGEFTIQAKIRFRDGREETVSYWLDLRKPWPNPVRRP